MRRAEFGPGLKVLPRARITWVDGQDLLLRGDALVKRNRRLSPGFATAFDELVHQLQAIHHASRQKPADQRTAP